LIPAYNDGAVRKVKKKEIYSAMKMYNERAIDTPKERSENWLGWEFKGAKRRAKPLKRDDGTAFRAARAIQDIMYPDGEWRNKDGRPKKAEAIREWREAHPNGKKIDCHKETGISRPTIDRWWNV
jgi:hypothetical protein